MTPLTFSAAMALDPSEVEVCLPLGGRWTPLADHEKTNFYLVRHAHFRRARPRKSRVQEMAFPRVNGLSSETALELGLTRERFGEEIIRAVCEWLRHVRGDAAGITPHTAASAIEREFLEPR